MYPYKDMIRDGHGSGFVNVYRGSKPFLWWECKVNLVLFSFYGFFCNFSNFVTLIEIFISPLPNYFKIFLMEVSVQSEQTFEILYTDLFGSTGLGNNRFLGIMDILTIPKLRFCIKKAQSSGFPGMV